ncbi:hypothetical protein CC80DRAFT_538057 [Byssothecium circinans]|uniref:Uncharacterized protein n=1 Tax=Byssothecium circinans TaxID=147558 RepID=A0A6A5TL43_9PLEO|nr:hypothetical protein CC80DRAFT_538057 [Byssothecium circinans]
MSTLNIVKYYFHKGDVPTSKGRMHQLIALGYQTARAMELYPQAVLVRPPSPEKRQKDPRGDHVTFSYKTQDHLGRQTHVACHGYVKDRQTLEFKEAMHVGEKPDSTKKASGKDAWPGPASLWEAPEIGYGHIPEK